MIKTTTTRPVKTEGYSSDTLHHKRDLKRREAKSRQAYYKTLTLEQQLALAVSRRGESKREIARIEKILATPGATIPILFKRRANDN